jgi:hypothetical protein
MTAPASKILTRLHRLGLLGGVGLLCQSNCRSGDAGTPTVHVIVELPRRRRLMWFGDSSGTA